MSTGVRGTRPSGIRLRVHLVPLGFDVARAVTPAVELRADVVVFLVERADDRPRSPMARALRALRSHRIAATVQECDIWDPAAVVDEVGNLLVAVPDHDYSFNVSTGARTASVGGTIASMFWPIRPYYQPVAYVDSSIVSPVDAPVTGSPFFIPTFELPSPDTAAVDTLRYLVEQPTPISKQLLMRHMRAARTIHARVPTPITPQAFHAQANVILRHLVDWGFAATDGHGKRMRIRATEIGRGGARMFRHVVAPRPVPALLRR